jgi:hypothetical protein
MIFSDKQKEIVDIDDEPLNYLGFGVVSYFKFLLVMIITFSILTLANYPVMNIYSSYNNF